MVSGSKLDQRVDGEQHDSSESSVAEQLLDSLQEFLEVSPVGEFPTRLRMLRTFYHHVSSVESSSENADDNSHG